MPLLVFFMLVFVLLGALWVIGAGLLLAGVISGTAKGLGEMLDYRGRRCTCHFPFKHPV
jgi:uncharacterized membrane protein YedE/YeeE